MTTPNRCRIAVSRTPRTSGVPVDDTYFEVAEPVTISGTGTSTSPYVVGLALSADPDNKLTLGTDGGLYAADGSSYWLNVTDYGAKGDGITDDFTAIQAAINDLPASGGTILVPVETYRITQSLVARPNITLKGVGDGSTVIYMSDPDTDAITGTDLTCFTLEDITIKGPGSGAGNGINFTRDVNAATVSLAFNRVTVKEFGGSGIVLSNPIVSTFNRVTVYETGSQGFHLYGVEGGAAGTSCAFTSCFADSVTGAGYLIDTMSYCTFSACAADHCGIGYDVEGAGSQGISFVGCGAEGPVDRGDGVYGGYGFKVDGAIGVGIYNAFVFECPSASIYVTGEARAVSIMGFAENSPTADATASVLVDAGCIATLADFSNVSPLQLDGTVNITNDGGGGTVANGFVYGSDSAYYEGNVSTTAAPTSDEHLTRKDYVDAQVAALTARLLKLEES